MDLLEPYIQAARALATSSKERLGHARHCLPRLPGLQVLTHKRAHLLLRASTCVTRQEDLPWLSLQDSRELAGNAGLLIQLTPLLAWRLVHWHDTFRDEAQPWGIAHLLLIRSLILAHVDFLPGVGSLIEVP